MSKYETLCCILLIVFYYDLNSLYNEICEVNPSKTKYKFDNRLEWGLKQNNKFKLVKRIEI